MFWAIGMAVAPGRMLGNFLPIHDAESLPCTEWVICTDPNGTLCVLFVRKTGFPVVLCVLKGSAHSHEQK